MSQPHAPARGRQRGPAARADRGRSIPPVLADSGELGGFRLIRTPVTDKVFAPPLCRARKKRLGGKGRGRIISY